MSGQNWKKNAFIAAALLLTAILAFFLTGPSSNARGGVSVSDLAVIGTISLQLIGGFLVWLIVTVQGFRTHLLWGLAILFIPGALVVFAILYADRVRLAWKIFAGNVALFLIFEVVLHAFVGK